MRPIIIRREEVVEGGHHGGAWKVAYADFVTAMMAFFLLMWLINATTEEQRRGLADYFSPISATTRSTSGTGAPWGGQTASSEGSMSSDRGSVEITQGNNPASVDEQPDEATPSVSPGPLADPSQPQPRGHGHAVDGQQPDDQPSTGAAALAAQAMVPDQGAPGQPGQGGQGQGQGQGQAQSPLAQAQAKAEAAAEAQGRQASERRAEAARLTEAQKAEQSERQAFEQAAQQIREAIKNDPALADLARQLAIDITPDGMRIQIMDEEKQPMFPTGSSAINDRGRALLQKVVPMLAKLTEPISITGHTDAAQFKGNDRGNWELSTERANATRRLLMEAGIADSRIIGVSGHADRDLLLPADPLAAANRRISVFVHRTQGVPGATRPATVPPAPAMSPQPGAATPAPAVASPPVAPPGTAAPSLPSPGLTKPSVAAPAAAQSAPSVAPASEAPDADHGAMQMPLIPKPSRRAARQADDALPG